MKRLICLLVPTVLVLASCQSGLMVKSTVNIPTVDTVKKHELTVGGSLGCADIQHNHLIKEKLVLAHSMSINTYDFEDLESLKNNFKTEIGLGLQAKHPWLVNFGYARRDAIIVLGGWVDGDIDEILIPNVYSFGFQKSLIVRKNGMLTGADALLFTAKIDQVFVPIIFIESWSHKKVYDTLFEFNMSIRNDLNKYFAIQRSFGLKFFWNQTNSPNTLSGHRLANELLYFRLHLLF